MSEFALIQCKHFNLNLIAGFAKLVEDQELPFCVNWTGPKILDMEINDKECQSALVKIVKGLDELKPNTKGWFQVFVIYLNCKMGMILQKLNLVRDL